jgi:DNA-binding beta-propeller fold protein YncE
MKSTTAKQMIELTKPLGVGVTEPKVNAIMNFAITHVDVAEPCRSYGILSSPCFLDPSNCQVSGKGLEGAQVGHTTVVTLQAISTEGTPYDQPIEVLECELVTERTGTITTCTASRNGLSAYCITYQPTIKGKHQLHIKALEIHVSGSPFYVAVRMLDLRSMALLCTIDSVSQPLRLALSQHGEIVVSETANHCVSIFSQCGDKLRSFGSCGSGKGQFDSPQGVAVDSKGHILVADSGNSHIQKLTARGHFLSSVDTKGNPCTVAFNVSNNRIYATDGTDRVLILNSDLTISGAFGRVGTDDEHFMSPQGISFDSTVFSADGKFLRALANKLHWPTGVATDCSSGVVYVSLYEDGCILKYSSAGMLLASFSGQLSGPAGLAVDNSGVLYVCDSGNSRVVLV